MKALVVGGGGFLGSEVAHQLQEDGFSVRIFNRKRLPNSDIEQFVGDISEPESYEDLISKLSPEIVIQSAWITEQDRYRTSKANEIYAISTLKFAEYCFRSGVRHFIGFGSSAEYGSPAGPCDAYSTDTQPQDPYGHSKLWTAQNLIEIAGRYSTRATWGRVFQPYGPSQDKARLLPSAALNLKAGKEFLVNNPDVVLDWITSRDIASAVNYTIKHEVFDIVDIGTSVGTTVLSVLKQTADLLGADPALIIANSGEKDSNSLKLVVSDRSPLFSAGWRPNDDLISGLTWTFLK